MEYYILLYLIVGFIALVMSPKAYGANITARQLILSFISSPIWVFILSIVFIDEWVLEPLSKRFKWLNKTIF